MNILYTSATCEVAHCGPLLVNTISGKFSVEELAFLERGFDEVLAKFPRIWVMSVLHEGYDGMGPGVREKASDVATAARDKVVATVLIIRGRGLMAVIARTALAAFTMFDRSGLALKVFKHLGEGLEFASASMKAGGHELSDADARSITARINGTVAAAS